MTADQLSAWLSHRDEAWLARLLLWRPDVLAEPEPHDLAELAERLSHPGSLHAVLRGANRPCLQLLEAVQALGGHPGRGDLMTLLAGEGDGHRESVDAAVDWLVQRAVLWQGAGDVLHAPPALSELIPRPLGLGSPARVLFADRNVAQLRHILGVLQIRQESSKAKLLESLLAHLRDPDAVRRVAAQAPAGVRRLLGRYVSPDGSDSSAPFVTASFTEPFPLATPGPAVDFDEGAGSGMAYLLAGLNGDGWPARAQRGREVDTAAQWARDRALLVGGGWEFTLQMPAEVALALRGAGYRAPFDPHPPQPRRTPADPRASKRESASAASAFATHGVAVLDHLARAPVAGLKSGGVGVRELNRLVKVTGASDTLVRLTLEVAGSLGLVATAGAHVAVTTAFGPWRTEEPAARFVAMLTAWQAMALTPTEAREPDGRIRPVLRPGPGCLGCHQTREGLLAALACLSPGSGTTAVDVAPLVTWLRPLGHPVEVDPELLATVWREAEQLGVLSHGALTDLGRRLVERDRHGEGPGDDSGLLELAAALLPATSERGVFGSDLTVMVAGAPSASVCGLLDSAADRESRGGAIVWRFSPSSVRRALDEGTSGADLERRLTAIAGGELPQPLRYLVSDITRRHGSLRVRSAVSCLRSDDEALLAEVAVDRRLTRLNLRLLAPTVLASDAAPEDLLGALRAAGYLPMPEDADGTVQPARSGGQPSLVAALPSQRRAATGRPDAVDPRIEPRTAAARLLGTARAGMPDALSSDITPTATEAALSRVAGRLSRSEIRQLAFAVDRGSPVVIEYESSTGTRSRRELSELQLSAGSLIAWCALRQDERIFTVRRILAVHRA